MENRTFEAYLGKYDDGRYLLYLDDADINLFEIIGNENINRIVFEVYTDDLCREFEPFVAYVGEGELTTIYKLYNHHKLYFDQIHKVIINENIELQIMWWEDHLIIASHGLILKCIEAQKLNASPIELQVLDLTTRNPNTYYQTEDGQIVVNKKIPLEEIHYFIRNSDRYLVKEMNVMMGV